MNEHHLEILKKKIETTNSDLRSLQKQERKIGTSNDLRYYIRVNENNLAMWEKMLDVALSEQEELVLSNLNLPRIPSEIRYFTQITSLVISKNNLFNLPTEIGELSNLLYLNISNNSLSKLPPEIWKLTSLLALNFSHNKVEFFPQEISKLINLQSLDASNNNIKVLPNTIGKLVGLQKLDVSVNQISSMPTAFSNLQSLQTLDISYNQLDALPIEITKLRLLRNLDINQSGVKLLPKEIGNLRDLQILNANGNKISKIPEQIGFLTNLEKLYIGDNQISEIPSSIGNLLNLKSFRINKNKLRSLPVEMRKLKKLATLHLWHNSELAIPVEIVDKINDAQSILNYYFSLLDDKKKIINEAKTLVIGQGSVGKTSLVQRLLHNKFDKSQHKTEGISINLWHVESLFEVKNQQSEININIWDFGGQEIMHATHQFFLTKRSLYLLVLDSRLTQEENRIEYWLKIIHSFGGNSPVLIVGNKIDQHPLDIDRTGLQKKYPNIVGILETSAATGAGIEELKTAITEQVNNLPHVRDLLPETWFTVKTKLEGLGQEENFITQDKYLELCAENDVSDETSQRTLIGFLHDLGVVLHFQDDPRLESLGILNPQWVTNGVYKILNSHELFKNKGVLERSMLNKILDAPEYPSNKRLFIVDMMRKFELCYDLVPDQKFLVPDLLPKDEPQLSFNGIPAFEYAYPVLPSSVITRFIVRMNQKIDDGFVWRTGVLLKIGENKALVKADIEDRKITIAIDGLEHTRRDALSAIRYQLDEIHASIKGLNPERLVPIPGAVNAKPLAYNYLLMLEAKGIDVLPVPDGNRLIEVNVRQMLSGVESEARRKDMASKVMNIYVGGDVRDSNIVSGDENEVNK